jgi:PAS domain S-box-containing protein
MSTNERGPSEQTVNQEVGDLTITDAIPVGISVLAPDGTILHVNRLTLDLHGLTLDEVKGKSHLAGTCHPDDLDRVLEQRRMGLSRGVPFELEMRLSLKKGGYRWYLSQYKPVIDERGNIVRWYLTATDIDDRKHAEEKLQQSEEHLRTITDTIRQSIVVTAPDGTTLYANRVALDTTGLTQDVVKSEGFFWRASILRTWSAFEPSVKSVFCVTRPST